METAYIKRMHRDRRTGKRGFSLVELMVTLFVASVVGAAIVRSVVLQQENYMMQLANTEAQQNARAALSILQSYLRRVGWGIAAGADSGLVFIGQCSNGATPDTCNAVDVGSDRIRIINGKFGSSVFANFWQPGYSMFRIGPKPGTDIWGNIPSGTKVVVSGTCKCPPDCDGSGQPLKATDIITIGNDIPDGQWFHKYQYTGSLSCNYDDATDGAFAPAEITDFRIDRTQPLPRLMMHPNGAGGVTTEVEVASNIDDLQISYGLDTTSPTDQIVDIWCNSVQIADCATGLGTTRANQSRIIAARVAVVALARQAKKDVRSVTVFDHIINAPDDLYRRFVYRTTVSFRSVNP